QSVAVALGAAVMALPVVGLAGANPADDQLLPLIRRFQEAEAELNASGPISDEESDVRAEANNKLLSASFGPGGYGRKCPCGSRSGDFSPSVRARILRIGCALFYARC